MKIFPNALLMSADHSDVASSALQRRAALRDRSIADLPNTGPVMAFERTVAGPIDGLGLATGGCMAITGTSRARGGFGTAVNPTDPVTWRWSG